MKIDDLKVFYLVTNALNERAYLTDDGAFWEGDRWSLGCYFYEGFLEDLVFRAILPGFEPKPFTAYEIRRSTHGVGHVETLFGEGKAICLAWEIDDYSCEWKPSEDDDDEPEECHDRQ